MKTFCCTRPATFRARSRSTGRGTFRTRSSATTSNAEKFAAICSKAGIANDTTVVFYGDKSNWWACYAFWAFKLFGHKDCRVMNGGRKLWVDQKRPLSTEAPKYAATEYKVEGELRVADSRVPRRGAYPL